ncbi:MAG: GTPase [Planctomycetota bacterium]
MSRTDSIKERVRLRCCQLTGNGKAAVAVVAVWGERSDGLIRSHFHPVGLRAVAPDQLRYGQWMHDGVDNPQSAQESVVLVARCTHQFEVHCHGGPAAVEQIIASMSREGAVVSDLEAWRAEGGHSLLRREAEARLPACVTTRTAAVVADQCRGAMDDWITLAVQAVTGHRSTDSISKIRRQAAEMLSAGRVTSRLSEPFRLVIAGPPNVGKSSLTNAIVGYDRSITFDQSGTTRDILRAETVIEGLPIQVSDTAGIRDTDDPIESQGVQRALVEATSADLILWVRQPRPEESPADDWEARMQARHPDLAELPAIHVLNKADLLESSHPIGPEDPSSPWIPTVATSGQGVDELLSQVAATLGEDFPASGQPAAINDRQMECLNQIVDADGREQLVAALEALRGVV